MLHASSWLGYSWDLADLVFRGLHGTCEDGVLRGSVEVGRVSRREKFRTNAGPSREELRWLEIFGILRKVRKLTPLFHAAENDTSDNGGSCPQVQPSVSASPKELESHRSKTPVDGGDILPGGHGDPKSEHLLQQVLWPFDTLGDNASMYPIEIAWEDIPSSADPVLGGGYRTKCKGETGRLQLKGRKRKDKSRNSKGEDVRQVEAHFEHGDSLGRAERKRWQVEKIASALKSFQLQPGATVVDFGCGSGALTLPLAAIFPEFRFVGVDFKLQSIMLLEKRARRASLSNVTGVYGRIENYPGSFDACVALHACGSATDLALLQAMKNRAAYVMSPCCVGKLQIPIEWTLNSTDSGFSLKELSNSTESNKDTECGTAGMTGESGHAILAPHSPVNYSSTFRERGERSLSGMLNPREEARLRDDVKALLGSESKSRSGSHLGSWEGSVSSRLSYPRSRWLRNCISEKEFQVLARAADWSSYDFESISSRLHSLCKIVLELDRNEASREVGYSTGIFTLSNEKAGTVGVSHVLVGNARYYSDKILLCGSPSSEQAYRTSRLETARIIRLRQIQSKENKAFVGIIRLSVHNCAQRVISV